jgi:hypothetical protein
MKFCFVQGYQIGRSFTHRVTVSVLWGSFLKITKVAHLFGLFFPRMYVRLSIYLNKKSLGYILGIFFTNSSRRPDRYETFVSGSHETSTLERYDLTTLLLTSGYDTTMRTIQPGYKNMLRLHFNVTAMKYHRYVRRQETCVEKYYPDTKVERNRPQRHDFNFFSIFSSWFFRYFCAKR